MRATSKEKLLPCGGAAGLQDDGFISSVLFACLPGFINPATESPDTEDEEEPHLIGNAHSIPDANFKSTAEKLHDLRELMRNYNIGVYIIPTEDEHQSEYIALADRRREYITSFTGSAGVAIVTLTDPHTLSGQAVLSTDGRYFLQAEKQLDMNHWCLHKQGESNGITWQNLAISLASLNTYFTKISFDPRVISILLVAQLENARSKLDNSHVEIEPLMSENLVDSVWGEKKPCRSLAPIYHHALRFSGEETNSKLQRLRQVLGSPMYQASHIVISQLDEIAWLFNLRSDDDIPYTPVFFAYAIVSLDSVTLYVNASKLNSFDNTLTQYLESIDNLIIKPYSEFYLDLKKTSSWQSGSLTKLVLPEKNLTTLALMQSVPKHFQNSIIHKSLVANLKVFKNCVELRNARKAQLKDSLVYIIFSAWLELQLISKRRKVTEYEAACKIYSIRQTFANFKGLSYETISSSGPNSAIIHYAPSQNDSALIDPNSIYLVDSGAHYLEGTTDITRTFMIGNNTCARYKKIYSLVLSGHLAVTMAQFPSNSPTTGVILDSFARQPLWNEGLDYNHGTGHGIGSFGDVHEKPLYISPAMRADGLDCFQVGAIVSDEPGYYIDGEAGFRIESDLEIIESDAEFARNGNKFLKFNCMTKVPFCRKLIDTKYLLPLQVNWVNAYHQEIRYLFADQLLKMGNTNAHRWLINETRPV